MFWEDVVLGCLSPNLVVFCFRSTQHRGSTDVRPEMRLREDGL
mgnify:CR=1 FL=1|jgi:hypothetical protein